MKHGVLVSWFATIAGLCAASVPASAAPGFVAAPAAGVSAPAPRLAPMRPLARFGHAHRGHAGLYAYPGFYGAPGSQQTVIVLPEAGEPPPERPSVPVVVGIQRPPAADPVLYRIEARKGRAAVRVFRFSAADPEPSGGRSAETAPR